MLGNKAQEEIAPEDDGDQMPGNGLCVEVIAHVLDVGCRADAAHHFA